MKTEDAAITPHDFDGHFSPFSYPITEIFWMLTELGEHSLSTRADHDHLFAALEEIYTHVPSEVFTSEDDYMVLDPYSDKPTGLELNNFGWQLADEGNTIDCEEHFHENELNLFRCGVDNKTREILVALATEPCRKDHLFGLHPKQLQATLDSFEKKVIAERKSSHARRFVLHRCAKLYRNLLAHIAHATEPGFLTVTSRIQRDPFMVPRADHQAQKARSIYRKHLALYESELKRLQGKDLQTKTEPTPSKSRPMLRLILGGAI